MNMLKKLIVFILALTVVGTTIICQECGHICDETCTYDLNNECIHECDDNIDPQDIYWPGG